MKTITFRMTLWYASIVTLTVAVILVAGRFYLESNLIKGVDFLIEAEFKEIFNRLDDTLEMDNPKAVADAILAHTEIDAAMFYFQVGTPRGDVIFLSSNMAGHALPVEAHGADYTTIQDPELGHLRVGEYSIQGIDVHIASSLQGVDSLFEGAYRTILWVLLLIFIFSLALGVFLSRVALNPIHEIQVIARKISAKNLGERIPVPEGKDEIRELCEFLNEMFERLEKAFDQISRFTAEASHELRTPLSLIRLNSERLLQNPELSGSERESCLIEQMAEIERLNKLIDDLLFLAKADAGVMQVSAVSTNLGGYLADFQEDARLLCEDQGVLFEYVPVNQEEWIDMDPVWMRHVLLNLLSNSLRYSEKGSTILLESKALSEDWWLISLADEGPGIPEDKVDLVFERFHMAANDAMEEEGKGSGLGLAICKSIISQHNGRIYARNRDTGTGLKLFIELPRMGETKRHD